MSVEQIVGGIVGGVIGFFTGGPAGAVKGALYGAQLGALFVDNELPPGPKLDNLGVGNTSRFGDVVPRVYGKDVLPARIIWLKDNQLQETTRREKIRDGLFSNDYQEVTEYSATFAVLLCRGPIKRVIKITANDEIIHEEATGAGAQHSAGSGSPSAFKFKDNYIIYYPESNSFLELNSTPQRSPIRIYRGDLEQEQDPAMVEALGSQVSALRGYAYVVFDRLELSNGSYNNQIPQLKFWVEKTDTSALAPDATSAGMYLENLTMQDTSNNQQPGMWLLTQATLAKYKYGYPDDALQVPQGSFAIHAADPQAIYATWTCATRSRRLELLDGSGEKYAKQVSYTYANSDTISRTIYTSVADPILRWSFRSDQLTATGGRECAPALIGEQALWVYPWDYPSKVPYSSYKAPLAEPPLTDSPTSEGYWYKTLKPILGSKDLFLIVWVRGYPQQTQGTLIVSIGKAIGDRMSIYTLDGLDLDQYHDSWQPGGTGTKTRWKDSMRISNTTAHAQLRAVFFGGRIYLFCNWSESTSSAVNTWFPGVIIVDGVAGLTWNIAPFERRDKLVQYGVEFYRHDGENYELDVDQLREVNKQFITNWKWNADYHYDALAPDYSSGRLYARNFNTSNYGDPAKVLISTINAQSLRGVYRVNPETGALITDYGAVSSDFLTAGSTAKAILLRTFYPQPKLLRVIDGQFMIFPWGVWDFINSEFAYLQHDPGVIPSTSANDPGGSLYVPSGSQYLNLSDGEYNILPVNSERGYHDHLIALSVHSTTIWTAPNPDEGTEFSQNYDWLRKFRFYYTKDRTSLQSDETITVDEILAAEITRTGLLTSADYDFSAVSSDVVTGLTIAERGNVSAAISALQTAFLFDLYEEDGKIKAAKREGASVTRTIAATDLECGEHGEAVIDFKNTVPINYRSPSQYTVTYRDPEMDYETNTLNLDNPYSTDNVVTNLTLPLVMTAEEALKVLDRTARATESIKRGMGEIQVPFKHSDLEPSDFITVNAADGSSYTLRITEIDKGRPGIVKIAGQIDDPLNYSSSRTLTRSSVTPVATIYNAMPVIVDALPFEGTEDKPGLWLGTATVGGASTSSGRAIVYTSRDNGESWQPVKAASGLASVAYCIDALTSARSEHVFDYSQTLTIRILAGSNFTTVTKATALQDQRTNTYFYGAPGRWEILKALTFTDNGDGTYSVTGLLSGYKGTAHLMGTHEVGDMLIAADASLVRYNGSVDDIGKPLWVRFASTKLPLSYAIVHATALQGVGRLPLPPVNVLGSRNASDDLTVTWVRQPRYGIEWVNGSVGALDEDAEEYRVYVLDAGDNDKVVRTIETTSTSATYTGVQQTTDWGAPQSSIKLAIAQYSQALDDVGTLQVVTL